MIPQKIPEFWRSICFPWCFSKELLHHKYSKPLGIFVAELFLLQPIKPSEFQGSVSLEYVSIKAYFPAITNIFLDYAEIWMKEVGVHITAWIYLFFLHNAIPIQENYPDKHTDFASHFKMAIWAPSIAQRPCWKDLHAVCILSKFLYVKHFLRFLTPVQGRQSVSNTT